jgi:antitoxin component of MazEF toxin-antitoxin module
VKPRLSAYRKLSKHGNSLMIAPPREFLRALGLLKGDLVELVLDDYSGRFYCKPVKRRTLKLDEAPPIALPVTEVL